MGMPLQDVGQKQVASVLGIQAARANTAPRPFLKLKPQHIAVQVITLQLVLVWSEDTAGCMYASLTYPASVILSFHGASIRVCLDVLGALHVHTWLESRVRLTSKKTSLGTHQQQLWQQAYKPLLITCASTQHPCACLSCALHSLITPETSRSPSSDFVISAALVIIVTVHHHCLELELSMSISAITTLTPRLKQSWLCMQIPAQDRDQEIVNAAKNIMFSSAQKLQLTELSGRRDMSLLLAQSAVQVCIP